MRALLEEISKGRGSRALVRGTFRQWRMEKKPGFCRSAASSSPMLTHLGCPRQDWHSGGSHHCGWPPWAAGPCGTTWEGCTSPPRVRPVCLPTAVPRTHHPQDDVEAQHGGDPPKGLTLQDGVLRLEAVTRRKVLSLSHHIQVPWRDSHPGRLPGEQRGLQVRYEATPTHYATCRSWGAGAGVH